MGSQVQKSPESSAQFEEHKLSHTDRSDVVRSAADTRDTFTTSFFRAHTRLGESPLYRAEDETLHYIDVLEGNIHVLKLVEPYELHTIRCPEPITFIGFCQSGGYIVCYFQGIAHVDEDGTWHVLKKIIPDAKKHLVRLNDGAIDSRGRLWFGTVDIPGADLPRSREKTSTLCRPQGSLYCYLPDDMLQVHEDGGFFCSNGMGWSPDESTMYFTDSAAKIVWAYDFDAARGSVSNKRVFMDRQGQEGEQDGLLVDVEGSVYTFLWEGSGVERYDSAGKFLRRWSINAWRVTHGAWVGKNYDQLVLTSATADGSSPGTFSKWDGEEAGALFWLKGVSVQGIQKHAFGH